MGAAGLLAAGLLPASAARAPRAPAAPPDAPTAARRSLALIQRGAANYLTHQECFSCHHQALPLMTCSLAERCGLPVNREAVRKQLDFSVNYFAASTDEMRRGLGVQGANDAVGYALAAFAAARKVPDDTTEAMAQFLVRRQVADGSWIASAERPPFEGSVFTPTALALAGLKAFGPKSLAAELPRIRAHAADWLRRTPPRDLEDRVYQLRGLSVAGDEAGVRQAVAALEAAQRPDGGWSQLPRLKSDAYATGAALLALGEAGGVPPSDPVYRKGIDFLLGSQQADGSWFVQTRAKPVQVFFDNGDPHGKSQFISFAATNLATMAILRSLPTAAAAPEGTYQ
jgi:N-acyl-D-amino-acid deacylase